MRGIFMERCVWIGEAYSPRDGGWVRWGCHFHSFALALEFLRAFEPLIDYRDYFGFRVLRTIAFSRGMGGASFMNRVTIIHMTLHIDTIFIVILIVDADTEYCRC